MPCHVSSGRPLSQFLLLIQFGPSSAWYSASRAAWSTVRGAGTSTLNVCRACRPEGSRARIVTCASPGDSPVAVTELPPNVTETMLRSELSAS